MTSHLPPGIYRIKNPRTGTYLTGSSEEPGTVHSWESRPDYQYQKWDLDLIQGIDATAVYHLSNRGDGRFLSIYGAGSGAKVCKALENPTRWLLPEVKESGRRYMTVESSDDTVNLDYGRPHNGAQVSMKAKNDDLIHRSWKFKRVGDRSADDVGSSTAQAFSGVPAVQRSAKKSVDAKPPPFSPYDGTSVYPETPYGHSGSRGLPLQKQTNIVPPAVYSIRNAVESGRPLNPDPYGSSKWVLQTGHKGYIFKNMKLGIFLAYEQGGVGGQRTAVVMSTEPVEWTISRVHKGYCIRPIMNQSLLIGLGGGDTSETASHLSLSGQNGCWKQVWRFEMANS